jgi:hypothetical protein
MMRSTAFHSLRLALAVALVLTSFAAGQPTSGDVIVAGTNAQPTVIRYDRSGSTVTATVALSTPALVGWIPGNNQQFPYLRDVVVDHDNAHAVGAVFDTPTSWLVRFDPMTGTVLGTLTHFAPPSPNVFYPYDVERDQDGGYILLGPKDEIWKVDAQGLPVTTLNLKTAMPSFPTAFDYIVDYEDGQALLFYQTDLFKLDRVTGSITAMYPASVNHGASYQMCQDYRSGRILWGTGDGTQPSYCRGVMTVDLKASPPVPTTLLGAPNCPIKDFHYAYGSRLDRQSAANPHLLFAGFGAWAGFGSVDLATTPPQVHIHHFLNGEFSAYGLDVIGSVNLTSRLTAPDRWEIALSFPGFGGKGYVLALGLSGTHPGISMGGRRVNLFPDSLTQAALLGYLAPYFSGNLGFLDAAGRGQAVLDLGRFKGSLSGRPFYFVALVLDPAAPGGVGVVSDPYVILPGASL